MRLNTVLLLTCSIFMWGCQTSPSIVGEETASYIEADVAQLVDRVILAPEGLSLEKDNIQYLYGQADLNGDGSKELLVLLDSSWFCGSGGCTAYLLSAQGNVLSRMTVVRTPILVDNRVTNDWKDLIVWSNGSYRRMQFNGTHYPSNPSIEPKLSRDSQWKNAEKKVKETELYQQDGYDLAKVEQSDILAPASEYRFSFKHYGDPMFHYYAVVNMLDDTVNIITEEKSDNTL